MEFVKTMNSRKSVRSYTGEPLTKEQIDALLKAAYAAPVGGGKYDQTHLTVITDKALIDEIDKNGANFFGDPSMHPLHNAPILIIVSASPEIGADVASANTGAIVENMSLAATDMGIGSLFIWGAMAGLRANKELLSKISIPEGYVVYGSMIAGKTEEKIEERAIPADKIAVSYQ